MVGGIARHAVAFPTFGFTRTMARITVGKRRDHYVSFTLGLWFTRQHKPAIRRGRDGGFGRIVSTEGGALVGQ